jgi:class 3 adenylate cyclase/predicted ATPase
VRRRGYRFIAPVTVQPLAATDAPSPPPPDTPRSAVEPGPDLPATIAPPGVGWPAPPALDPARLARATGPGTPAAERRHLTVLFCDLVASTALATQLDPEDLREVIRAYHAACAEVIQRYAGYIAQYLGDGLLVYFGYPQAQEDDARRAVHTGLGLVAALGPLNTRLEPAYGIRLAVRVGIHTGLVVVGALGDRERQEPLALGATPNLAARLQDAAAPDTVVMSGATARLVEGYFVCQPRGAQALKGLATPVPVFQGLRASGAQSRLDIIPPWGLTPLVGRDDEVALLHRRWEQATTGQGQVVLLSGEPGIGKSRLVQVLQEHVTATPHTRIAWRGSPYHQQSALYPVIAELSHRLRWHPDTSPAARLRTLEPTLAAAGLALAEAVPLLAVLLSLPLPDTYAPLPLTPQRQRQQTLELLLAWLHADAQRQPVLLIVEDLHWLDPSTLELLSLLIDQSAARRLCLVLTARPEFHPPWPMGAHLSVLTLRRLAPAQIAGVTTHVAGGRALPLAVLQEVVRMTDGVPLFVEELTKTLLEIGLLEAHADGSTLPGPLPPLAIPATLHDALMARLDRLAAAKEVAQLGATIGRTFAYDLLHAVSPWDETALQHGLRQLEEAELLSQRGVPPQATYTFKHALIQETAYQALLKRTRQQYHQRIARVLEEQFPEIVETQPELLAQHYTQASLLEQAVHYWQRAGQRAVERSATLEAVAHLRKGLEVLTGLPDTPERAQRELALQLALGSALIVVKGWAAADVAHAFTRARALCAQAGDTRQRFRALNGLFAWHLVRADLQAAWALGEQALRFAQRVQHSPAFLWAHFMLGETLFYLGDFPAARDHFAQGVALDRALPGDARPVWLTDPGVACRSWLAQALWVLGCPDQAVQHMDAALALAQGLAQPFAVAYALDMAAELHQFRQEGPLTQARADALLALSTEQAFAARGAQALYLRGWARATQGQGEEGIVQIGQGIAAWRATGAALGHSYLLALLAEAYSMVGRIAEGRRALAEALAHGDHTGERYYAAEVYRLQGELLLRQVVPDALQAEACFQQAIAVAHRQQAKAWELRAATSLARLWQQQSKQAAAYALLAPVYGWFSEGFDTADLQEAKALLAALDA